jgi:hypothetical protein
MRAGQRLAWLGLTAVLLGAPLLAQSADRRHLERLEETLRMEGEAVIALADAAADEETLPAAFALEWHNDFLKARQGTFIPFIITITPPRSRPRAALLYVRAARHVDRGTAGGPQPRLQAAPSGVRSYPFEEVYPVDLSEADTAPHRFIRGFALEPGDYEVTVVVRERVREGESRPRLAGVLRRKLSVPDFATAALAASTVVVADRMTPASEPLSAAERLERPYVIGGRQIEPAADLRFRPDEELIVVFLVYNPAIGPDKQFDIDVEYHFFSRTGSAQVYLNRTEPQRFTPDVLGPSFDPAAGQPLLAGQGVPLAGFSPGDYKLRITVTDRVAGRTVEREVAFTVGS